MALERQRHSFDTTVNALGAQQRPDNISVVPTSDSLSPARIAFTGRLLSETWRHAHTPLPFVKIRRTKAILSAYDALTQLDDPISQDKTGNKAHVIVARLGGQKEEIDADATTWEPVRARHEILHAVGSAAKLGRPYLNILQDRTGLTPERLAVLREEVPPSSETEKILTEDQRFAAEAVCSRLLLQKCLENVKRDAYEKDLLPNKSRNMRETGELLKAHIRVQNGHVGETAEEIEFDARAAIMVPELEEGRNKIFDKAQLWEEKDMRRKVKAASRDFRNIGDPQMLQDLTGITPEMIEEAKKTGRMKVLGSWMLAGGNEALSHAPGVTAVTEFNVQDQLPSNPWILGTATVILYGALAGSLIRTSYASANLLESTGVGLDPWSKWEYDHAVDNEKKAALKGALKYHAAWEVPFFFLGLGIGAKYGWEAGLTYFNTASVAGIIKNTALNAGVETFRAGKSIVERRKEINSFLPK